MRAATCGRFAASFIAGMITETRGRDVSWWFIESPAGLDAGAVNGGQSQPHLGDAIQLTNYCLHNATPENCLRAVEESLDGLDSAAQMAFQPPERRRYPQLGRCLSIRLQ